MIGERNRRITFKSWGSTQDEGGGAIPVLLLSYPIWAKVEPRNGRLFTGEQQSLWTYDYKITIRYERSRIVQSNYLIDYDNKRLSINSVSFEDEGNRKNVVLRCSTIDAGIDTSLDILKTIHTFDYYGISGEDNFTADGTPMSLPTIAQDLRGKTIIGAYKDGPAFNGDIVNGMNFVALLTGTPDPTKKEVIYNSVTGNFWWSIPFEPGEHALIQYF